MNVKKRVDKALEKCIIILDKTDEELLDFVIQSDSELKSEESLVKKEISSWLNKYGYYEKEKK